MDIRHRNKENYGYLFSIIHKAKIYTQMLLLKSTVI